MIGIEYRLSCRWKRKANDLKSFAHTHTRIHKYDVYDHVHSWHHGSYKNSKQNRIGECALCETKTNVPHIRLNIFGNTTPSHSPSTYTLYTLYDWIRLWRNMCMYWVHRFSVNIFTFVLRRFEKWTLNATKVKEGGETVKERIRREKNPYIPLRTPMFMCTLNICYNIQTEKRRRVSSRRPFGTEFREKKKNNNK